MEYKEKKRIVFIVYKAGWWGCFDSLYRELIKHDSNECHVIPVPYYERSKDGDLDYRKKHYEADLLPKDIPVTEYKSYSLREHHPEVIYIHNPYDTNNPADSVEPEYYSANLKECTDQLVYLPHMLYIDGLPELMRKSSVYQNADKIMLANEDMKNAFVGVTKEKLVAAGSPLVNYIEKMLLVKPDIPESWRSTLTDDYDFNGKRIILYHVSYSDLYFGNENTIKKIAYVFDHMKTRKDITFIWRNEPEIEGRLGDLPNNVQKEFLNLRKRFIDEQIGIYDTTDNEGIVSVLTDAYIGGAHPMMNLYGIQGKPIIILDKECRYLPSDDELSSVSFLDFTVEGDDIWFVADEYNALCRMNVISENVEVIAEIPDERFYGVVNYCGIIKEKDRIYLNPYHADGLVTYNMISHEFTKTYLTQPLLANFDYIVSYKDDMFLKAKQYPAIIRYNKNTEEMIYYTDWVEELEKYVLEEDHSQPYFLWGIVVSQNKLMMASSKANIVMEFNMDSGNHRFYEVGPQGSKYFGMEYDGTDYWMIPYLGKNIIRWNGQTGDWIIYSDFADEILNSGIPFRTIIMYKQSLVIIPCQADFGLKINLDNFKIEKHHLALPYPENTYKSDFYKKANTTYNLTKYIGNGVLLAEAMYDSSILLIDMEENKLKRIPCRIPFKEVKAYYDRVINMNRKLLKYPCSISEDYTLRALIDYIAETNYLVDNNEKLIYYSNIERKMEADHEENKGTAISDC